MITTLTGKNTFELQKAKSQVVKAFIKEYSAMALEQYDCENADPQVIYDALTNIPFLVAKKLVVLNEPSKNKSLTEKLPDWLGDSETIEVLIVEPAPDKRTSYFKFLQKSTHLKSFEPLHPRDVLRWVVDYAKEQGAHIRPAAGQLLIERAGHDQLQLAKEIEKLALYSSDISETNVELLVEELPQNTVFDLLDSLVAGKTPRAMELYDVLLKKRVDPNEIIAMLGWQLHTLALIRAAGGGQADVAAKTGLHPFVVQKNFALASRLSPIKLKTAVDRVVGAELDIKRAGQNAENVTSVLLFSLSEEFK